MWRYLPALPVEFGVHIWHTGIRDQGGSSEQAWYSFAIRTCPGCGSFTLPVRRQPEVFVTGCRALALLLGLFFASLLGVLAPKLVDLPMRFLAGRRTIHHRPATTAFLHGAPRIRHTAFGTIQCGSGVW